MKTFIVGYQPSKGPGCEVEWEPTGIHPIWTTFNFRPLIDTTASILRHQMPESPLFFLLIFFFLPAAERNQISIKENANQSHSYFTGARNQNTA